MPDTPRPPDYPSSFLDAFDPRLRWRFGDWFREEANRDGATPPGILGHVMRRARESILDIAGASDGDVAETQMLIDLLSLDTEGAWLLADECLDGVRLWRELTDRESATGSPAGALRKVRAR